MEKDRSSLDRSDGTTSDTSLDWGKTVEKDLMKHEDDLNDRGAYPFFGIPRIYRRDPLEIQSLLAHVHELRMLSGNGLSGYIACKLCMKEFENVLQLRIHLLSKLHKDLEYQLKTIL